MQIIATPPGVKLWPDDENLAHLGDMHMPIVNAFATIDLREGGKKTAETAYRCYKQLLQEATEKLQRDFGRDFAGHNFIMSNTWMVVVPRRTSGGVLAANSLGMMGLVWCATDDEKEMWVAKGPAAHLKELAWPWNDKLAMRSET